MRSCAYVPVPGNDAARPQTVARAHYKRLVLGLDYAAHLGTERTTGRSARSRAASETR